jgi:type II secretory pathway pseudopilin PulG
MRSSAHPDVCATDPSDGSSLVEAVVGIALLGAGIATVVQLMSASTMAMTRAQELVGSVRVAERILESRIGDIDAVSAVGDEAFIVSSSSAPMLHGEDPCSAPMAEEVSVFDVRVAPGGRDASREVRLAGVGVPAQTLAGAAPSVSAPVRLHLPDADRHGAVSLGLGGGAEPFAAGQHAACVTVTGIVPGSHEVVVLEGEEAYIDRTHQPLSIRPIRVTAGPDVVDRVLDVSPSATVRADVDGAGGRLPDVIGSGALRWFIRGDDARTASALGHGRDVHPGTVTVVVSACLDPESVASAQRAHALAGEVVDVSVALATVVLEGIGARSDATVLAIRTSSCADGSGLRPSLRWNGGLFDGMRIALPHGVWEVRLQTAGGSPLTFPTLMAAGEPDLVVVFP